MAVRFSTLLGASLLANGIALVLASPANARDSGTTIRTAFSKTNAILGGSSALQAVLDQQKATSAILGVQSQSVRIITSSFPPVDLARREPITEAIAVDRPNVFGTVALRVNHTPLDAKWRSVGRSNVGPQAARYVETIKHKSEFGRLEAINWYVNRRVQFEDDRRQFGRADVWSAAAETLRRGRGDCEDYAIAKLQMLRRSGIAERDLYLVIVKDLVRRADHAVLVARSNGHMYVLDNGTDEVIDSASIDDYRPVLSFSAAGEWTHGYRMNRAPVQIAAAPPAPFQSLPTEPSAGSQRSRSASLLAFNMGLSK
jgi:predicted transglutaminase-like cysteine proteinase